MKTIGRKLLLTAASLLLCAGICLINAAPARAETFNYTNYYDLNGDGTNETCKMYVTYDSDGDYVTNFKFTDDGRTIYSKSIAAYGTSEVTCEWVRLTRNQNFVQIIGWGDDGDVMLNWIFRYDSSAKKLVLAGNLMNYYGGACEITGCTSNTITVRMMEQPCELGSIVYNLVYKYSNGKFSLSSPYAAVHSNLGNAGDCNYDQYFSKNQFKSARTLTFYTAPGSKTKSFTITKGKWVTLTKIRVSKSTAYYQFRYKTGSGYKYGWVGGLDSYKNPPCFTAVHNHLTQ